MINNMTKKCGTCSIIKHVSEYYRDSSKKDGIRTQCKSCTKIYKINTRERDREKIKERLHKYNIENRSKIRDNKRVYRANNKEYIREWHKKYRFNKSCELRAYYRDYKKSRKKTDALYKLREQASNLIRMSFNLKGFKKNTKTYQILGCSFEQLFSHLKQTAINNYGGWHARIPYHIDHKIPLSSAKTTEEIIKLCHYTNLQYLTAEDNLKKGSKLNWSIEGIL